MTLFGATRSRLRRSHALFTPESFVRSEMPGWENSLGVVLISPPMGARFVQYLALLEAGGSSAGPAAGIERMLYVIEGCVSLRLGAHAETVLESGGFAYWPPGIDGRVHARVPSRVNVFEKRYIACSGSPVPEPIVGSLGDAPAAAFMGDPDVQLQALLPADRRFDLAVNVISFAPGATLPLVEMHVMEHGLLMLEGQGIYRLDEEWYPVREGDVIWMAPYCPQWFVAMGKTKARYLYYKDVNRDPIEEDRA
jgi:(S)-ureidoglycine aminohydrolase